MTVKYADLVFEPNSSDGVPRLAGNQPFGYGEESITILKFDSGTEATTAADSNLFGQDVTASTADAAIIGICNLGSAVYRNNVGRAFSGGIKLNEVIVTAAASLNSCTELTVKVYREYGSGTPWGASDRILTGTTATITGIERENETAAARTYDVDILNSTALDATAALTHTSAIDCKGAILRPGDLLVLVGDGNNMDATSVDIKVQVNYVRLGKGSRFTGCNG